MLARAVAAFMPIAVVVAMIVVAGVTRDCRRVGAVVLVLVFVQIVVVVGEVVMLARAVAAFMPVPVLVAMIVVAGGARDGRRVAAVVLAFGRASIASVAGE